ncbi:MAG TPA: hypothetical protein GXX18_04615 [Bacillales bacterium]|nr:hypothetical protein [Bacillales bacterium]
MMVLKSNKEIEIEVVEEILTGSDEVRGAIPLGSTIQTTIDTAELPFFYCLGNYKILDLWIIVR